MGQIVNEMNGIEFFNPSESNYDSEDLPWVKDWAKSTNEYADDNEVLKIYPGDKGLLIFTGRYKAFIFRKDSLHNYLVEALESWHTNKTSVSPLVAVSNVRGKVSYGLNHDKPKVSWAVTDGAYVSIRLDEAPRFPTKKSNPFLEPQPSDPNSPTQNKGKTKKQTPNEQAPG